jgi:hypothetical protein
MSVSLDPNSIPFVRWRDLYDSGGHHLVLRRYQALSAQGCAFSKSPGHAARARTNDMPYQSALRQMVYLVIKELSSIAEDVIMVTSSIMKDMQPNLEVVYRPNAIRALARIIDVSRCGLLFTRIARSTHLQSGCL